MDYINKMLARFLSDYRLFLAQKNKFCDIELDNHLDKYAIRYSIIVQQDANPICPKVLFSIRRKKGLKKHIFSKVFNVADFQ